LKPSYGPQAIFQLKGYSSAVDDLGHHIEVQATVDEAAQTIRFQNVKRLAHQGPACAWPTQTGQK